MRGHIIGYSLLTETGAIAGDDGNRYALSGQEWRGDHLLPETGMYVDFDVRIDHETGARRAIEVFWVDPDLSSRFLRQSRPKNKTKAGLFALFLGLIGVHKFYLGHNVVGIIYIILTLSIYGVLLTFPASIIDGIIYITKSDDEFDRIYVQGRRPWF